MSFHITVKTDTEHRDVVELRSISDKLVDCLFYDGQKLIRRILRMTIQRVCETLLAKQIIICVRGFGDAVRVDEDLIARLHCEFRLPEADPFDRCDGR